MHRCPECGFEPERRSAIEEKPGSLVQLNGKRRPPQHSPQLFYSMSLWIQRERGYKPGYAAAKFKGRFGHWPRGLAEIATEPDIAFLNLSRPTRSAFTRHGRRERSMLREPLKDRAAGRWPGILAALGVPSPALRNRHGPCPIPGCGGRDRFRFDDKGGRGTWICSKCGAGDGIELVKRMQGVDFKEAARLIEQHIGAAPVVRNVQRSDAKTREEIAALWQRSKPITLDDPAGKYLHARLGLTDFPDVLRYAADERYCDYGSRPTWHPMMVARVDPSDAAAAEGERPVVHRTYLDKFGGKADVPSPRKVLGSMPTGAAIRLAPATRTSLGSPKASRRRLPLQSSSTCQSGPR